VISSKRIDETVVVIYPANVLDNNNAHEMKDAISRAKSGGCKHIILNLSGLEFISSAGVGAIISSVQSSREAGGDTIICSASNKILHIFKILGVCDFLTIAENEEAARDLCPAWRPGRE
jgi:anti-sigma B factor antagonist